MNYNWRKSKSRQLAYFKYGHTPANRRWLVATITAACIVLVLMLCMLFGGDKMSMRVILWLRGFAGVFALISIISAGIYYYRIYTAYWNDPANRGQRIQLILDLMKKFELEYFLLLLILGFVACNNNVFVEYSPEIEDTLYLDGYHGKQSAP